MGTNELQVPLSCGCGRSVVARAKDAGGEVSCTCGRQVAVPRLSELRTLAGADAYVTNPAEAIRKLQSQGINPAGNRCLLCGATSPTLYACHAVCESSLVKTSSSDDGFSFSKLLSIFLLPKLFFILYLMLRKNESQEPERRGHDVAVDFTLPVCGACLASAGGTLRPKMAKELMASVPTLADLLAYYPQLKLTIDRDTSS